MMTPPPCALHLQARGANAVEDAGEVGRHDLVEGVDREVQERLANRDPGIVHHDVEPAPPVRHGLHGGLHGGVVGHVGGDDERVAAVGFNQVARLFRRLGAELGQPDARPVQGKSLADGPSEAGAGAGYQRRATGKWRRGACVVRHGGSETSKGRLAARHHAQ